ncbi:MAG: hypothetical protein ABIV06_04035, partial [Thermoanaerobaculia bacterium]
SYRARGQSAGKSLCYDARVSIRSALPATSDFLLPGSTNRSSKLSCGRWLFGGLSAVAIGALVVFHAVLFAGRIADASLAHPEVLLRWIGAILLAAGALALRRQGNSLVSGRSAVVFWLLVLLLHVGFGSGLSIQGAETGNARELLLLLPFAAFTFTAAKGLTRGSASRTSRPWELPLDLVAGTLRFFLLEPAPACSSAGAGPARFSPRPPPLS